MRIITGDECGLLKETIPELSRPRQEEEQKKSNTVQPSTQDGVKRIDPKERQSRSRGVVGLAFTAPSSSAFAALRVNGSVELWEGTQESKETFGTYHCTGVANNVFASAKQDEPSLDTTAKGRPMALESLLERNRLCAADSIGNVAVLDTKAASVVATYSPFAKQAQTISYTKGQYMNMHIATAMAVDGRGGRVAIGGRERETSLLDMETGDIVWKAKNLPPDPQTLLQHPIWSTALLFLDSSASFSGSNHVMAAGTAYKQVRLYDVRTDSKVRRPICHSPEGQFSHRITALCQASSHHLVVGDTAGYLHSVDLRKLGHKTSMGRFVGPSGSIRQLAKHDELDIIASVGLDRMLRTYNVTNRKQLDCVYLKQRLNCLLFCRDETWSTSDQDVTQDLDDHDIDIEDDVQDYVDSDDESSETGDNESAESTDNDDLEEEEQFGDDDDEVDESDDDDSSNGDDEREPSRTGGSKRRRT